jgi:RNA-directed DNA polymerase
MPEDAPGNPGAGSGGPGDDLVLLGKVRGMQARLHRWAGEDSSRRFGDLFNLVYDPDFLAEAWWRVRSNAGSRTPGIDQATVADIENRPGGVGVFLDQIRDLLKSGEFRPDPVRQVMIPKKSGKLRKLGIATVADRVVQAALKLVLEPIFEADFQPCSYGFRPNRRAHDAIAEIHHLASGSRDYHWILEADIRACFDEISHVALMDRVRARITDKRVLALVKAFLKAGVMTADGDREETYTGTPQGGILSPLLANIALSALDDHFTRCWQQQMGTAWQRAKRRKHGLGNWRLIRYADLCRGRHKSASGSPFSRSKLRPWLRSVAGCTTHARSASSRPGSAPMPTAWTTWSGCAGRTGSNAPSATALEAGGRVIAGSCAPPAGTGPR